MAALAERGRSLRRARVFGANRSGKNALRREPQGVERVLLCGGYSRNWSQMVSTRPSVAAAAATSSLSAKE